MANLRNTLINENIAKQWTEVSGVDLDAAYASLTAAEKNIVVLSLVNADSGAKDLMTNKFNAQFLANATRLADENDTSILTLQTTFLG